MPPQGRPAPRGAAGEAERSPLRGEPSPAFAPDAPTVRLPDIAVDRRADDPLAAFKRLVATPDVRVLVCAESAGRRETMLQYFAEYGAKPVAVDDFAAFVAGDAKSAIVASPVHAGFAWRDARIAFVTEAELYAGVVRRGRRDAARRSNVHAMVRDLSEVRVGDPVVHEQHGIGRYLGLTHLDLGDGPSEFLELVYANDAKLYVPVSGLHQISRYSGASPESAPLHELGSGQWEKAKRRAAQKAHDTAAELLNLYAQRAARKGHAFSFKAHDYEAFAEGFGFEETPDQQAAIHAVIQDMVGAPAADGPAGLRASKSLPGNFLLKTGVRMENTRMEGRQTVPADTSFLINRTDWFPYAYLSRPIMKIASFSLQSYLIYRRTITRPGYQNLNPYIKIVDPYLYETGNPALQPQFTDNIEANISFNDMPVFAIGRNYTRDIFSNVVYQDPQFPEVAVRTFDNVGKNRETYFRIVGAIPPGGKYFFVVSAQYNLNDYNWFG